MALSGGLRCRPTRCPAEQPDCGVRLLAPEDAGAGCNTRCHRCGGLLGMGRTVLSYRVEPSDANRIVTATDAISELTRRRGWYVRIGNYTETFCQKCGEPSYGVMSTPWHRFHSAIAITSPRIAGVLNAAKAFLRRRPSFEDAGGNINIPLLLSRVRFPVYGLRGERSGLRLRELSWVGQGNGRSIGRVRFLYAASGEGGPERAIALTQAWRLMAQLPQTGSCRSCKPSLGW